MGNRLNWTLIGVCLLLLGSCEKEPQPIKVTGITLNPTSLSLVEGETANLSATISPKDADNQSVIWSSNDGSIASVNNGNVSALKAGATTITAKSVDGGFTASCSVTVTAKVIDVSSVSLSKTELTLTEGESETITATVKPDDATNKDVSWVSSDNSIATVDDNGKVTAVMKGTATITAKAEDKTAQCIVLVKSLIDVEAIDLGLSVKWASFNLGASKPEEYGDYYAWGETEPYYFSLDPLTWKPGKEEGYWYPSYKWCMGSHRTLTKYCYDSSFGYNGFTDTKTVLDPEDDAAYVALGGNWHMPTYAEWEELIENCTWIWTEQNGVAGRLVTGPNGNSIFLPAAGFWNETNLYRIGSIGYYWSSSLDMYCDPVFGFDAWCGGFNSDLVTFSGGRPDGFSIRPVLGDRIHPESVSLNKSSLTLYIKSSEVLTAEVLPTNAAEKSVSWSSSNTSVVMVSPTGVVNGMAPGTAIITATTNDGDKTASCNVTVLPIPLPDAVDLGLSVKWASFNVGASKPEEYGDYYAWGETDKKDDYSWATYKWCNGDYDKLTKYCNKRAYGYNGFTDSKTTLDLEDDAAHVNLGEKWRMPTDEEWTELRENCSWTCTAQNGVYGWLVTASNGNSIFLPAAGHRFDTDCNGAGFGGFFWSSSLLTKSPNCAWAVYSYSDDVQRYSLGGRHDGRSIRPVYVE